MMQMQDAVHKRPKPETHSVACPMNFSRLICLPHSKRRRQFPFSNSLHTVINMIVWTRSSSYFFIDLLVVSPGVFLILGRAGPLCAGRCHVSYPRPLCAFSANYFQSYPQYPNSKYLLYTKHSLRLPPVPALIERSATLVANWAQEVSPFPLHHLDRIPFQPQCQIAEAVVQKGDNQRGIDGHLSPEC